MTPRTPRVGVVVVSFDGAELTMECLRSLARTDWPADALDVVLVDNGSSDGVAGLVRDAFPSVRVVESATNRGFAGGCNLGIEALPPVDYVALVNNDVVTPPDWLRPLVAELEADRGLGAACPKILLQDRFRSVRIRVPTSRPGRGDRRELGVRVSGARVRGADVWPRTRFASGGWGRQNDGGGHEWTGPRSVVLVPVPPDAVEGPCELRLDACHPVLADVESGSQALAVTVTTDAEWHRVPWDGPPFDVLHNAGTVLGPDAYGADRGYLERDDGQYDEPDEVFAWCGAAVVLSDRYLREVGLLDERLFLYYEDLELAWRGRRRGWRYRYVPTSVVRHRHSATSGRRARDATYYNERNHLLVAARHARSTDLIVASWHFTRATASYFLRDVVAPLTRGSRPEWTLPAIRARAFTDFVRDLPPTVRARRSNAASEGVPDRLPRRS